MKQGFYNVIQNILRICIFPNTFALSKLTEIYRSNNTSTEQKFCEDVNNVIKKIENTDAVQRKNT